MTSSEIPGGFYDIEYFLSMELRYLSGAHQAKVDLFKEMLPNIKNKKILDVGCGGGYFTNICAIGGAEVIGIDYSESAIQFAKDRYPKLDFRVANAQTLNEFSDTSFDVVLLIDVIEHIHDQLSVLKQIKRILRPNGILLISTDLEDSKWNKEKIYPLIWTSYMFSQSGRAYRLIKKVEAPRRQHRSYHDSHVSIKSLDELLSLLKNSDFKNIKFRIYALVRVPLRDLILKLFPKKYRGDHVMITAQKIN